MPYFFELDNDKRINLYSLSEMDYFKIVLESSCNIEEFCDSALNLIYFLKKLFLKMDIFL